MIAPEQGQMMADNERLPEKKLRTLDIGKLIREKQANQRTSNAHQIPVAQSAMEFLAQRFMSHQAAMGFSSFNQQPPQEQYSTVISSKPRSKLQAKSASFVRNKIIESNDTGHYNQGSSGQIQGDFNNAGSAEKSQPSLQTQISGSTSAARSSQTVVQKEYPYKSLQDYYSLNAIKQTFESMSQLHTFDPSYSGPCEFFAIRSSNDFDLHKAIKYGVWSSTKRNNPALQHAWEEMQRIKGKVILFFTVVDELDEYRGVAEMVSPVDTDITFEYWYESSKFTGLFNIRWLYVQNVSYSMFEGISTYTGPVHLQRDGTRLSYNAGKEMLRIFHKESKEWLRKVEKNRGKLQPFELNDGGYPLPESPGSGWLLDDFKFMDGHEEMMRRERDMEKEREANNYSYSSQHSQSDKNYSTPYSYDREEKEAFESFDQSYHKAPKVSSYSKTQVSQTSFSNQKSGSYNHQFGAQPSTYQPKLEKSNKNSGDGRGRDNKAKESHSKAAPKQSSLLAKPKNSIFD